MPATPNGLPYPSQSDAPNVPADIEALAAAVDALITGNGVPAAYTPAVAGITTTAANVDAKYTRLGKQLTVEFGITATGGSPSTILMSTPTTMNGSGRLALGVAFAYDDSVGSPSPRSLTVMRFSATQVMFYVDSATSSAVAGNGVPWTWAANDKIAGRFTYWEA